MHQSRELYKTKTTPMKLPLRELIAIQCLWLICLYMYNVASFLSQTSQQRRASSAAVTNVHRPHIRYLQYNDHGSDKNHHPSDNDCDNDASATTTTSKKSIPIGGIHGCARFSTKYEARYLVPWLHYHKRLGISHFHLYVWRIVDKNYFIYMYPFTSHKLIATFGFLFFFGYRYFDSAVSNLTIPIERKAYELVTSLPYVTVYDVVLSQLTEGSALQHCVVLAHQPLKAEWVMDFDLDEIVSFNQRLGDEPYCQEGEYDVPKGKLEQYVATIPDSINAIILPRINFRSNGLESASETHDQMELFVHREAVITHAGKILHRTRSTGRDKIKVQSKHDVRTNIPDSVSYPCGVLIPPNDCDGEGYCAYGFNKTQLPQEIHLQNVPFLYHYVTRSTEECLRKLEDLPSDHWRIVNSKSVCGTNPMDGTGMIYDYGLYCSGKATTRELRQLYPSYHDEAPFIF